MVYSVAWLIIGFGGAIGAMARHALNSFISQQAFARSFPLGIFIVNVVGSLLIGLLAGLAASGRIAISEPTRMFLAVGVLGGFTTFSSFSLDTLALVQEKRYLAAAWNA